jgi:thiamine biosynthesis lipoprotein
MRKTEFLMGMPVTVEVVDHGVGDADIEKIFDYFKYIDEKFSTYKPTSEVSRFNRGELSREDFSQDMKTVFRLSEETKKQTDGYFDIMHNGNLDPSGLVKGWAIYNAADILKKHNFKNYYVEAGGDIQVSGKNQTGNAWQVGIKNPFNQKEIIKVVYLSSEGIATSGSYIRGQHIYNPKKPAAEITDIVSLSVIGPNIYEADRFATACFAMGLGGINFLERLPHLEGYMVDKSGIATMTSGWEKYTEDKFESRNTKFETNSNT